MTLPFEILALLSPLGFEDRFYMNCKIKKTYQKAYEQTELEYKEHFGKRRYSSYDSFRVVLNRKLKKK
tara:strand:- start:10535 stop:10738 length:204 start_codon:yes stop_codon:yes gene_type:complete